jgi:hypothetical protein
VLEINPENAEAAALAASLEKELGVTGAD